MTIYQKEGILMKELICTHDDVLEMLDSLLREPAPFWEDFYSDRNKVIPFFTNKPDENLHSYFERKLLKQGKVLELGCGPGRNAIFFAEKGSMVDAVDLSQNSLQWARERAKEKNININFIQENIFNLNIEEGTYDIVYDSGCFHHIAPHRRMNYIDLIQKALKPRGHFALTCFVQGGEFGGANISDWEVYKDLSLKGGLGFTEEKLRIIFKDFEEIEIRRMKELNQSIDLFGISGLWTALFRKN